MTAAEPALRAEGTLSAKRLAARRLALTPEDAFVALPKFETAGDPMSLASTHGAMGVETLFDPRRVALSGMAKPRTEAGREERLCVSEVFHNAFVRVDEKGTEAAAATASSWARPAPPAPAVVPMKRRVRGMPSFVMLRGRPRPAPWTTRS